MSWWVAVRWSRLVGGLVGCLYLQGIRAVGGAPFRIVEVGICWLFAQSVLELGRWAGPVRMALGRWLFSRRLVKLGAFWALSMLVYVWTRHTLAAWAVGVTFYALLVVLSAVWRQEPAWRRGIGWAVLAVVGGGVPVVIGQVESRFAEEEFFAVLQAVALGGFVVLMLFVYAWMMAKRPPADVPFDHGPSLPGWGVVVVGSIVLVLGGWGAVWAYQHSFYPPQVPTYPGVSVAQPFLCGTGIADDTVPGGEETFARLLAQVETNPHGKALKYGMLALATGERRWAEAFRGAILQDVREGRYTTPANSVKSTQYLAARRVYYLPRVIDAFPEVFSLTDLARVRTWLNEVNRRTWTVEWVDGLYGLAFAYPPQGPYENQENGAGLLALLEAYHLTDGWSASNRDYLARNRRGWFERFRNTDDTYTYQLEWIDNAFFQTEYWQAEAEASPAVARNRALAFEWLLLQALPDGGLLYYNHPRPISLAQVAYLGAVLLHDPRYVWWSARVLDWLDRAEVEVYAQPGLERPLALAGVSPRVGSCLMFGDSGLPTQKGPLAPDKVVFRDGWTPESRYLLLNLRFSGWHRYKATNAVVLLYQNGPLVVEQNAGPSFAWLPTGRSLWRDKRVPRQGLNGLLVPRTGMAAVLYGLTGWGGPWAQDPPYYAQVERFETRPAVDVSRTVIEGWRGWRQERTVYFYHEGPIVVLDRARGPRLSQAALVWHVPATAQQDGDRFGLRGGAHPAEMVLRSWDEHAEIDVERVGGGEQAITQVMYRARTGGQLDGAAVFLTDDWVGATVTAAVDRAGKRVLRIVSGAHTVEVRWDDQDRQVSK